MSSYKAEFFLRSVLGRCPDAVAYLKGSGKYPDIHGYVRFYGTPCGVLVVSEVCGLPPQGAVFGFHIHSGGMCEGDHSDPFSQSMSHYDRGEHPHPYHSGDLPPLFGNSGSALSAVLTERFCVQEIIGRTVIVHSNPDDFTTQPSGNSGEKMACGVIEKMCRR